MKKYPYLLTLAIFIFSVLALTSCTKDPLTFTYELPVITSATTTGYAPGNIINYSASKYIVNLQKEVEDAGAKLSNLKSVKFKTGSIELLTAGQNFDNIDYVEAFIKASTLDSVKFAYKAPIPKTGLTVVDFDSQYSDLAEYFKQDTIAVNVSGYNSVAIPVLDFRVKLSVEVTVAQD